MNRTPEQEAMSALLGEALLLAVTMAPPETNEEYREGLKVLFTKAGEIAVGLVDIGLSPRETEHLIKGLLLDLLEKCMALHTLEHRK